MLSNVVVITCDCASDVVVTVFPAAIAVAPTVVDRSTVDVTMVPVNVVDATVVDDSW